MNRASAMENCRGCGNIRRSNAIPEGTMVTAEAPRNARAAISSSTDGANAASAEATA